MCAAQGLDFRRPLKSGSGALAAHARVREIIAPLDADRVLTPDIEAIAAAIGAGRFTEGWNS
jgi:histidine ammonia-lyase